MKKALHPKVDKSTEAFFVVANYSINITLNKKLKSHDQVCRRNRQ